MIFIDGWAAFDSTACVPQRLKQNRSFVECDVILTANVRKNLSDVPMPTSLRFFATLRMTVLYIIYGTFFM
jgi:hypothetical protein